MVTIALFELLLLSNHLSPREGETPNPAISIKPRIIVHAPNIKSVHICEYLVIKFMIVKASSSIRMGLQLSFPLHQRSMGGSTRVSQG